MMKCSFKKKIHGLVARIQSCSTCTNKNVDLVNTMACMHLHIHCRPFLNILNTNTELAAGFSYFDDLILPNKHILAGIQNCVFNNSFSFINGV